MITAPRISIVVRCFNEEQHIGRLLSGILAQTAEEVEIIVVDSGSTDATLAIARRFPVEVLTIAPEQFSFGRALNLGCAASRGEFIVAASAHVYPVYHDWLECLTAPFADPAVVLVYGKQRGNGATKYSEHQLFVRWFPDESNPDQSHPFCNNANAVIRRSLWEMMPYDEDLTGLEDLDWARRAQAEGYKIAYAADAEVVHVHEETLGRIFNRYRREAIALHHIMPEERFTLLDFIRLYAANMISDSYHAWHDGVLGTQWASIFSFRLMQFWGTYQGFRQSGPVSGTLKQRFYYPTQRKRKIAPPPTSRRSKIDYTDVAVPGVVDKPLDV